MSIREDVRAEIKAQMEKADEYSPVYTLGMQLMDILAALPEAASEIVLADLSGKGMTIADCEKKIKAKADEIHKKRGGNVSVGPHVADKIIREFYGIAEFEPKAGRPELRLAATPDPEAEPAAEPEKEPKPAKGLAIRLEDFF